MKSIFLILILLIVLGFFVWKTNYPAIKGKLGEMNISTRLSFLPADKYIVFNDLYFKFGEYSIQIDHLVISVFGIFVIETKNFKGWIFGNAYKNTWTQSIWGKKYPFYNPLFQNESHVRFLKRNFQELNIASNFIYPVVVFLTADKLVLKGDCKCVIRENDLNDYIKNFNREVLTYEYCLNIASLLSRNNILDKKIREMHIHKVYSAKTLTYKKIREGICPRCGGKLLQREGRYGRFYGCSNYPSCRYIQKFTLD